MEALRNGPRSLENTQIWRKTDANPSLSSSGTTWHEIPWFHGSDGWTEYFRMCDIGKESIWACFCGLVTCSWLVNGFWEKNLFRNLNLIEIAIKTADFRFLMSFLNKKLINLSGYLLTTSLRHDSTCQSSRQSLFPDREITGFVAPEEFFFTLRWKESSHCK